MNIKQRLIKLEKATPAAVDDIHIARFFVKPDESESDFKARCHDVMRRIGLLVKTPDISLSRFIPIDGGVNDVSYRHCSRYSLNCRSIS
jgi:hypothetical protein